jgi:hypothetical protein
MVTMSKLELLTAVKYDSATTRARAFKLSFISLISLSTSSMNLTKSSLISNNKWGRTEQKEGEKRKNGSTG